MVEDGLPYRIAVLCYLYDAQGRLLLLHRARHPNRELYSPVGGKLERAVGESPTGCAIREIREETGLAVAAADLHLTGIVSEKAFGGENHWLMFLYEVTHPVDVQAGPIDEGTLAWHDPAAVADLAIPDTDRAVIWPLVQRFRGRFFAAHIDCSAGGLRWRLEQPADVAGAWTDGAVTEMHGPNPDVGGRATGGRS